MIEEKYTLMIFLDISSTYVRKYILIDKIIDKRERMFNKNYSSHR
jgi:hypothetical protein